MIYAVVKQYATSEDDNFKDWHYRPVKDHYDIYDKVMEITGGDVETSIDAASWTEDAPEGAIYEFREGEIEIMDIS